MGLLRDVEQCVRSAEVFISLAVPETSYAQSQPSSRYDASQPPQQQPNGIQNGVQHWVADLALRNGSRTSSSPPYSKTEDHASDDSDVESIDQEIDHEVGFSVEVYAKMLATLMRELRDKMDHRNYHEAEAICKIVMKHSIERETNLGIPFDDRSELEEILAETCLEQERYQKAKTILRPLLRHGSIDPDHRSRLHLLLARAHAGRNQLNKAETLAQAALRTREDEHGKEHHTTQETALFLISIYEQQGEQATANALRMIYCPHFISPPPPRSALRHPPQQQSHQRQTSSQPQPTADLTPPHPQSPSEYEDDGFHPKESHVHWAPDVVTSDSSINALSDSGQTLLIHGIRQRDDLYVKLTVDRGASVDKPCADTITPLMHAVIVESESIVEFLLDKGADMEIPTSGWTPLHKATQLRNLAIMELLLDAGADIEAKGPLEFIQPRSEAARMKALARDEPDLERDIRCRENLKWTPLLRAAFNGEEAATRLLLDHGANIEARNPKKATPLMCACENLHTAVAGLLLERGAKVHAVDEYGWTPLHRTLVNPGAEQHKIITLLLSHSADINAKCSNGCTPLHYAVKRNEPAIVTCLLAHRADIEARDSADLTPLHTAINCRLEPMVRLLLERGADASAKNGDEDDALAAARHADRQSPEIIGLLRKHQKITKENLDAIRGNFGRSRRVSTISSGTGAADAVAEPSKKPEKKGLFGRKLSKEK